MSMDTSVICERIESTGTMNVKSHITSFIYFEFDSASYFHYNSSEVKFLYILFKENPGRINKMPQLITSTF